MTGSTLRALVALFAAAALAGCGSDSTTAPVTAPPLDLAAVVSQLSSGGLDGVPAAASLAGTPATIVPPIIMPASCTYTAAAQGFVCPTANLHGLTFNISYFLYDAAGHPQSQTSGISSTTASVRTVTDAKGSLAVPSVSGASAALVSHSDNTLSGLLTANSVLNGTSTSHFDMVTTGIAPKHSIIDVTTATANVVFPPRNAPSPAFPLSGTVTSDLKNVSSLGSLPAITSAVRLVLTFNGTSTPILTITLAGVTRTCKVDLSGKSAPVCS